MVTDEEQRHIGILHSVQSGTKVDDTALSNAAQYFEHHTVASLKDEAAIKNAFFASIGESYRTAFSKYATTLVGRLKTKGSLSSNVYSWCNSSRKPPAYVLSMMKQIIALEKGVYNGNEEEGLEV